MAGWVVSTRSPRRGREIGLWLDQVVRFWSTLSLSFPGRLACYLCSLSIFQARTFFLVGGYSCPNRENNKSDAQHDPNPDCDFLTPFRSGFRHLFRFASPSPLLLKQRWYDPSWLWSLKVQS